MSSIKVDKLGVKFQFSDLVKNGPVLHKLLEAIIKIGLRSQAKKCLKYQNVRKIQSLVFIRHDTE